MPALLETESGELFVTKFRGAGQGARALIAELIVGMLGKAARLPVPDLAVINVLPDFGRTEPDPEIQDLLKMSAGANIGMRYLESAFNFDPVSANHFISSEFASRVVWLDAFVTNPDRTARNPNLMIKDRTPWLIDHGAALYVHHDWESLNNERIRTRFDYIRDHVLLARADNLKEADVYMRDVLTREVIVDIINDLPEDILADKVSGYGEFTDNARERYLYYLMNRLEASSIFTKAAEEARHRLITSDPQPISARR